jgi:hypothetical protein
MIVNEHNPITQINYSKLPPLIRNKRPWQGVHMSYGDFLQGKNCIVGLLGTCILLFHMQIKTQPTVLHLYDVTNAHCHKTTFRTKKS